MARFAPFFIALVVGLVLACDPTGDRRDNDNFRPDVVFCEEALATLTSCCPGFDPTRVRCQYHDYTTNGCGSSTDDYEHPALSQSESECIFTMRCPDLVATGVCARAQAATPYIGHSDTNDDPGHTTTTAMSHAPVCP